MEKGCVLTIGLFDGLHIGHRKLIGETLKISKEKKIKSVVITFDGIKKGNYGLLSTPNEKIEMMKNLKIDEIHTLEFKKISHLTPYQFFYDFLLKNYPIKWIVVGENFRFGKNRQGDAKILKNMASKNNIKVKIVKLKKHNHKVISSSLIKQLIMDGEIQKANELLNRTYSIKGDIISGQKIGRKIGFPTLNLKPEKSKLLPKGVYLTFSRINGKIYPSLTYIGTKPTVSSSKKITFETYIINNQEIKGKKMEVGFIKKLRDEKKFRNIQSLKKQIKKDLEIALKLIKQKATMEIEK